MGDIKFAVCGFGRIGRRHAKIIDEFAGAELTAVIDINESQERQLKELGIEVPFYSSLSSFLNSESDFPGTDVINICTPNGLHAPLAVEALNNGYHTVVEKPMALTKAACEEIIDTSMKQNRQVFIVKQNRYSPPSRWLKKIVSESRLGKIYTVQISCFWNRDDRYYKPGGWHGTKDLDGGTLFTQFSHFIDIMYWIFGDIEEISGRLENFNHNHSIEFEDSGIINFRFSEGGLGSLNYSTSCWNRNMESSITVIGEKGSLKIGGQYMDEVEYCHIENYEKPELEPTSPPNDYGPFKGSAANHHYVIENVIDTLAGDGEITANAMEGMKTVEIIEKIYKNAES